MEKKAEEFLSKFKTNLSNIKRDLKSLINERKNINLSGIYTLIEDLPMISPKDGNIFLFSTIDKTDLLYYFNENSKYYAGKLKEKKPLKIYSIGSLVSGGIFLSFNFSN